AQTVSVTLNGENWQFPSDQLRFITIANLQGYATVNIEGTAPGVPVTVNLGSGTDTVNITPTSQDLHNLFAGVQVNGGAGLDTLNVDDQANTSSQTYTMIDGSISRSDSSTISYVGINAINLNGGQGIDDTYAVQGTDDAFTTIHTGSAGSTVDVLGTTGTL